MGRGWLGWREGRDFVRRAAWIVDVSVGGCRLAAEGAPPDGAPVFIRIDGENLPQWFEARVLEVRTGGGDVCGVRLAFPDGCPYDLFMALANGRFRARPAVEPPR